MTEYSRQIQEEQKVVDHAYKRLDDLRAQIRERLDSVRARGGHGSPTQRSERDSFAVMYEDRLMQLRSVEDRLVFGRIDDNAGNRHHIGRIGLSDENHDPILTDWRAEAARPFYEATPEHHGDTALRRHITLSMRTVTALEDEILDAHSDQVAQAREHGTLTGEGALLASLSSRRTGKMTDIVATIQAEQDRIIRSRIDQAVVVQGGPGTGKTAVALHRAAYLLYTHRRALHNSGVLIIGPGQAFLHYIDQVLPSLGETGVISRTIGTLIPGISAETEDTPYAAALKGSRRMADMLRNAIAARIRIPRDLPVIPVNGIKVPLLATDIEQSQRNARSSRKPHNQARDVFVNSMLGLMVRRYADQLDYTPDQDELDNARITLRMSSSVRKTLNTAWLPMSAQWLVSDIFSKPHRMRQFAPWLKEEDIQLLLRPKGSPFTRSDVPILDEAMDMLGPDPHEAARREVQDADRRREEEYARQSMQLAGVDPSLVDTKSLITAMTGGDDATLASRAGNDREWAYGHIVIDEAQELTPMDWRMLIRRCPSRSFTIVGDVAQTSAIAGTRSWSRTLDPLFGPDGWELDELTVDYRNPKEVCDLSSGFARSEGLHVSTVSAARTVPDSVVRVPLPSGSRNSTAQAGFFDAVSRNAVDMICRYVSHDGSGRIAVICDAEIKDAVNKSLRIAMRMDSRISDAEFTRLTSQPLWDAQVNVCTPAEVKGLEYDTVILARPGLIMENAASRAVAASDLYVAMTRPTQKLIIIESEDDKAVIDL